MSGSRGQPITVPVVLSADGGEIALGLSLCFDTNVLTFDSARRGSDASGTSFLLNTNQSSRGRIGITLTLSGGTSFSAGDNAILDVTFRNSAGNGIVTTPVSICDSPIARDILDSDANSVVATYGNATVTLVGSCSYRLDTNATAFSSGGGAGGVLVTADPGCGWSTVSLADWITLSSGSTGSGKGSVGFDVAVNPDYVGRTGVVVVAGQSYVVTQEPVPCSFRLNLNERVHGPAAEFNFVEVTTGSDCRWAINNTNSWITITSGTGGTGSGRIDYWAAANTGGAPRTGTVMIANAPFTVRQLGYPCNYTLTPESRVHSAASEAAILNVSAPDGCAWYVVNTNNWMIIKLYTNGVGNDIVRYTVFANPQPMPRSGVLTIGGQPFTVYQVGAPCTYGLLETSRTYGPGPTYDTVSISTLGGCSWTATTTNNWIVINTPNGTGGGIVSFYVSPNSDTQDRTGYIQIANRLFLVTQIGTPCRYSISPTSRAIGSGSNTGQVAVSTSIAAGAASTNQTCHWTALNTNTWITVYLPPDPTNRGTVRYSVAANTVGAARTGVLNIGGQNFTVSQAGVPCTYSVSPTSKSHGYVTETGVFNLTAVTGCSWTATADPWIVLTSPASGVNSGIITYQVMPNTGPARTGRITIGGAVYTVNQGAAAPVTFSSQPASRQVAYGSNVTFSVVVTGTPPFTYQWRFNGVDLQEGPGVTGVYTSTLSLQNVQPANSGNYSVVVSNLRGPLTSATAVLTVNTPPRMNPIPARSTVQGSPVTFTATATDLQAPPQRFTYSLLPGVPAGSSINATSGVFLWTPPANQPPGGYPITVRVTDNGIPPLSDEATTTISVFAGYTTNITLIPTGSVWKYRDTGEDLGTAWTGPGFDDALWAAGPAKLGYGDPGAATLLGFGPDSALKYPTTYFRTHFDASALGKFSLLNLRLMRDDGAVVYLNGSEVYRDNMPAGPINYLTLASTKIGAANELVYIVAPPLDPARIVAGDNVMAVEIHQNTVDSSDIGFDLELKGTMNVVVAASPFLPPPELDPGELDPSMFEAASGSGAVSVPLVRIARAATGGVKLSWNTVPALRYRVEYSTNITHSNWMELKSEVLAQSRITEIADDTPGVAQRFYRVLLLK